MVQKIMLHGLEMDESEVELEGGTRDGVVTADHAVALLSDRRATNHLCRLELR